MDNINPKTGKRMGKFLWRDDTSERSEYLKKLQKRVADGFYSSENVLSSIIDELAPALCSHIGVDVVQ